MKNEMLNTDYHTFLIKFMFKTTDYIFIVQGSGLMECIKKYDINGIKYIKIFDPAKSSFKRVSRGTILQLFSWETETYLFLKSHYYFK